jgi:UDP-N-acetylmuramoyl-tripeptide--D-alanyl-D-alanine ligase
LTLFDLDPSYDIAVLELGTNRPGEISRLGRIARPSACVIINVGEGHLERLKDTGGVLKEKMSLLDHLSGSGTAFLNKDDLFLSKVSDRPFTVKFFGLSNGSDFHVTGIKKRKEGCSFLLNGREFRLPLEGEHNVSNAAAAIAVAEHYGISERELRQKLEDIVLPDMRLEKVIIGGVMFINDTYNANPPSFECALKVLEGMPAKGGKGVVAGEMLELGEKSAELHEMIGKSIAEKKMDFLVTVGDMAKHIARGAAGSGMDEKMIFCAENQEEAARNISRMAKAGDIVLIKGSRASRMEEVLKCFTISCTH